MGVVHPIFSCAVGVVEIKKQNIHHPEKKEKIIIHVKGGPKTYKIARVLNEKNCLYLQTFRMIP